ncbi:MAG: hypothetical protein ACK4SY_07395 [Pyrobaculum sp.]
MELTDGKSLNFYMRFSQRRRGASAQTPYASSKNGGGAIMVPLLSHGVRFRLEVNSPPRPT